jgi:ABC-type uncharacterized transport system substrate-binding protein
MSVNRRVTAPAGMSEFNAILGTLERRGGGALFCGSRSKDTIRARREAIEPLTPGIIRAVRLSRRPPSDGSASYRDVLFGGRVIVRRTFLGAVAGAVLAAPLAARAQHAKLPRVGVLSAGSPASIAATPYPAFEDGLRALGWVEGRNILLDRRFAEEHPERFSDLAVELVRLKVDVIVAAGGPASLKAARDATKTIPIVMVASTRDPIGEGFIKEFARPGGNITGLVSAPAEVGGKQLELLKAAIPTLSRIGIIWDASVEPFRVPKEIESVARALGVEMLGFEVREPADFEGAIANAVKSKVGGLIVASTPLLVTHRSEMADVLTKQRLPAVALWRSQAEAGLLMTYGPSLATAFRAAAVYVDKILKGASPRDLPVEQPTKYELVINLKTAKALGVTLPQSLLVRADELIQ